MSRGIRSNTLDRIMLARERDPCGIGPLLGELAVRRNIPATMIAEMVDTHEQTVMRWIMGQSEVQAYWLPAVTKLLGLLVWMRNTNAAPLTGTTDNREKMLREHAVAFRAAVKSSSRSLKPVA